MLEASNRNPTLKKYLCKTCNSKIANVVYSPCNHTFCCSLCYIRQRNFTEFGIFHMLVKCEICEVKINHKQVFYLCD